MSFAQELKDFTEGFQKGSDIGVRMSEQQRLSQKTKRFGPGEEKTEPDPFAGAGGGAIPESHGDGDVTGSTTGDDIAWKDATPEQKAFLNTIAGPESGGRYNVIYGGGTFNDYKDHPRKDVVIQTGPNAKRTSSAAGKYQFLGSTWDDVASKHGLKDFSPENQDKAAWYLAADKVGGEDKLNAILRSGDPKQIAALGQQLSSIWTSLPSGIEQTTNTDKFVSNFNSNLSKFSGASPDQIKTASEHPTATEAATGATATDATTTGAIAEPGQTSTQQASSKFVAPAGEKRPVYTADTDVSAGSLANIDPNLAKVTQKAIADNPGLFAYNPYSQAGKRTPEQQQEMVNKGYSKTLKSKHVEGKALDLVPINPATGKPDPDFTAGYSKITAAMRKAAQELGIKDLKWGGDWKTFKDRPHWEVSQLEDQQIQAGPTGGMQPPTQAEPTMFAATGGVIPEPAQYFQGGGSPWDLPNAQRAPASDAQSMSSKVSGQGWLNYGQGQGQTGQNWGAGGGAGWSNWNTGGPSTAGPPTGYNRDNPSTGAAPPTAGGIGSTTFGIPGTGGSGQADYGEYQNWLASQPAGTTSMTYDQWSWLKGQADQNAAAVKAAADKAAADKAAADKAAADKAAADKAAADKAAADKAAADQAAADKAAADKAAADQAAAAQLAAQQKAAQEAAAQQAAAQRAAQEAAAQQAAQQAAAQQAAAAKAAQANDLKFKILSARAAVQNAANRFNQAQMSGQGKYVSYSTIDNAQKQLAVLENQLRALGVSPYSFAEGGAIPDLGDMSGMSGTSWTGSNPNPSPQAVKPAGTPLGGFGGTGWDTLNFARDRVGFAEGGRVPNRDELFRKYLQEESGRGEIAGQSARDRAAKRLSQTEGRPASSAYSPDPEYFRPRKGDGGGGGGGKPDTIKTSSTGGTHVRHPPNPTVGTPELAEDRATRFRKGEIEDLGEDRATRFRESELVPTPSSVRRAPAAPPAAIPEPAEDRATRERLQPKPHIDTLNNVLPPEASSSYRAPGAPAPQITPPPSPPPPPESTVLSGTIKAPGNTVQSGGADRPILQTVGTPQDRPPPGHENEQGAWVNGVWVPANPANVGFARGGAIPDEQDQAISPTGRAAEAGYTTSAPGYRGGASSARTPTPGPTAADSGPDEENYHDLEPTPRLMHDVARAVDGGLQFIKRHFGLEGAGAVPAPEDGAARQDGTRRFASGEGGATQAEINQMDGKVDPERQLNEGDRQLSRLGKAFSWYEGQGRKEDAQMAAASLLQYGATKFSQLGYRAQAAYEQYQQTHDRADLDNTVKILQKAYEMIPDGARLDVKIGPNGQLQSTRTNADGEQETFDVKPEDLPGLMEQVQNKSAYWTSVMRVADPEGYRSKLTQEREDVRAGRTEKLQSERLASQEKRADERLKFQEKSASERSAQSEKMASQREKWAFEREQRAADRRDKIDAAKAKLKDVDWGAVTPLISAAEQADNAVTMAEQDGTDEDKKAAQDNLNKSLSAIFDALPPGVNRFEYLKNMGFDKANWDYVGGGKAPTDATSGYYTGDTAPAGIAGATRDKRGVWGATGADGKWHPIKAAG